MLIETPKIPHLLQRIQWIMNPVEYMEGNTKQYPDIFEGKVVGYGGSLVFVNHPQAIQEILTNSRNKLSAPGEFNDFLKPFIGSHSMVTLGGNPHKKRRKLLMPSFHGDRMSNYGESIVKLTERVINKLPINKPFSARKAMQEISLQVILEVIFGLQSGELYQEIINFVYLIGDLFESPLNSSVVFLSFLQKDLGAWSPWGNFLRQKQKLDKLLYAEIAQRRLQKDCDCTDILSLFLSVRDEEGNPMSDEEIKDELIALVLAGHENTATALAWGLYWTHKIPEVKTKILAELKGLDNTPDPMTIFRLPYLTAACNETLRIYPMIVLTFPRLVEQPMDLLGYQIEQGKVIVGGIYALHHREDLYPNSKQFRPERFLERQFSYNEFIPFGMGKRRCIGDAFAMFKIKLVLSTILSNYQLALVDNEPEKPQRRGLTIAPANGVQMMLLG